MDASGVPEQFIGQDDLLPSFWPFSAFLQDNPQISTEEVERLLENSEQFEGIEDDNVYQVQYLTDAEVNSEFPELHDNIFPDANQDWPEEQNTESFHEFRAFKQERITNEGFNL
jgi:hypothetical protein